MPGPASEPTTTTNVKATTLHDAFLDWLDAHEQGWGLAWYLAAELCERFYPSHGIVPHVIEQEGLGYYGIRLDTVRCPVHKGEEKTLGRFTMAGNVENWISGEPGDHGLKLEDRVSGGKPVGQIAAEAIQHLRLLPYPRTTHLNCRHKRWGASYVLMFRLAAIMALRYDGRISIWNHTFHTERLARELDPKHGMKEHLGHFLLHSPRGRVFLAGDGRVLEPVGEASLWERYMSGHTVDELLDSVEAWLELALSANIG